jgi:SAM-dependent methyltransferase
MSEDPYFQTRLPHDVRRERAWRYVTKYLGQFVSEDASVLELGAGYCYFVNNIVAQRRVAVDHSEEMLRWKGELVEGICSDVLDYLRRADADQFDFVLASNFFEHFDWPQLNEMIKMIRRVIRNEGRLAVIQPNFRLAVGRYFDDYTHKTIFTDVSLADWLRSSGFMIVRSIPRFLPLTVKSPLSAFSFLTPIYFHLPYRPFAGQMFILAQRAPAIC